MARALPRIDKSVPPFLTFARSSTALSNFKVGPRSSKAMRAKSSPAATSGSRATMCAIAWASAGIVLSVVASPAPKSSFNALRTTSRNSSNVPAIPRKNMKCAVAFGNCQNLRYAPAYGAGPNVAGDSGVDGADLPCPTDQPRADHCQSADDTQPHGHPRKDQRYAAASPAG